MLQTIVGGAALLLVSVLFVVGMLAVVRRGWPPARLKPTNEVVSAYGSVIGTTYAVILAFMLSGVWTRFDEAQTTSEQEATALVQVVRLAQGLPAPYRHDVKLRAHHYIRVMLESEWPQMQRGAVGPEGADANDHLWQAILAVHPHDPAQQAVLAQMLESLSDFTRYRAIRRLEVNLGLPAILWWVLVLGGVITVGVFSLFGVEDFRLHAMKSIALTVLVSVVLVAIAEIDQPYQGYIHVPPVAFQLASATLDRLGLK